MRSVTTTPFGAPVVPEVNMMVRTSFGSGSRPGRKPSPDLCGISAGASNFAGEASRTGPGETYLL